MKDVSFCRNFFRKSFSPVFLAAIFAFGFALAVSGENPEIARAETYGEVRDALKFRNFTGDVNEAVMDIMAARHPFNYGEDYKRAVATHFAAITNYNVGPSASLLFRGMEFLGTLFGPKKMFELPPGELEKELLAHQDWQETYPPIWARVMFTIDSEPLGQRHYDIVRAGHEPSEKVLLLLHGGGMILPMSPQHWTMADYFAKATGRDVYVPDYPVLPNVTMFDITTFCFETYRRILENHAPEDVVMMGDSAGCALCLTVCYRCLGARIPPPSRLVLVSPAHVDTDEENLGREMEILSEEDGIIPLALLGSLDIMLPAGDKADHNECDPFHGQLGGFPPMDIYTGTREIFAPQAVRFYELARRRGARATLTIGPRCIHDWILVPWARESVATRRKIAQTIRGEE